MSDDATIREALTAGISHELEQVEGTDTLWLNVAEGTAESAAQRFYDAFSHFGIRVAYSPCQTEVYLTGARSLLMTIAEAMEVQLVDMANVVGEA